MSPRLVLPPLLAAGLFAGASAAADNPCAASGCHETLLQGRSVHAAAESCDGCHEATAKPHPQKGKKTFRLAA
ncbi:MAG TPA: hypothetical protein VMN82_14550, partial [Thermoanaerobaculia bacterium]|nr:hypothetical protein [Thermoanaerobaculia bacterium]